MTIGWKVLIISGFTVVSSLILGGTYIDSSGLDLIQVEDTLELIAHGVGWAFYFLDIILDGSVLLLFVAFLGALIFGMWQYRLVERIINLLK